MDILSIFGITLTAGVVVGGVVTWGMRKYFGKYLEKKAENWATKEDIGEITDKVESVKRSYAHDLAGITEELRARTSMRLVAAEKRLEVHQSAYLLWGQMLEWIHRPLGAEREAKSAELMTFWSSNCLYLDAHVREAFLAAMKSFFVHREILDRANSGAPDSHRFQDASTENFNTVIFLGDAIVKACHLPPIAGESSLVWS